MHAAGRAKQQHQWRTVMAQMSRAQAIAVLRRTGHADQVARAEAVLPDVVDTERDARLLRSFHLSPESLMEDLGSSP